MSRKRQQKKPRESKRSAHETVNAAVLDRIDQLMRATTQRATATMRALLNTGDMTHVDLDEWLQLLNEVLIQLCAPLDLDHVLVLGHETDDDGTIQVYTASNFADRDQAHQLVALGHDSIAADPDDQLCPDCKAAEEKYQSELS